MSSKNCSSCGAPVALDSIECKYCGEKLAVAPPPQAPQYAPPQNQQYAPPQAPPQYMPPQAPYGMPINTPYNKKSKTTAGILAILLGGLGIHKFYLGRVGLGILYILFCWTYVSAIIGLIEGIIYLTSNEEVFYNKYVKK